MFKTKRTTLAAAIAKTRTVGLVGYASAALMLGASGPAAAGEVDDLKAQMRVLMERIQQIETQHTDRQVQNDVQIQRQEEELRALEAKQDALISEARQHYIAPADDVRPSGLQPDEISPGNFQSPDWRFAPANAVTGGDQPGSFKLPGSDTSMAISGYIKGDITYDIGPISGGYVLPTENAGVGLLAGAGAAGTEDGGWQMHAAQSRLRVQTWTPSRLGMVTTHWEADFFSGTGTETVSNSHLLRMRVMWGELGKWGIGQNWSVMTHLYSYTNTATFGGPPGQNFLRQAQLRYTTKTSKTGTLILSLENPNVFANGTGNLAPTPSGTGAGTSDDDIPDLVGRWQYANKGTLLSFGGVVRKLNASVSSGAGAGVDDDAIAWMAQFSGRVAVGKSDRLAWWFNYGDGAGRYILTNVGAFRARDASVIGGELRTNTSWGAGGNYRHRWNKNLVSWLQYGHYENEDATAARCGAACLESSDRFSANLVWNPVPRVRWFLEYQHGWSDNLANTDETVDRIQMAGQFSF